MKSCLTLVEDWLMDTEAGYYSDKTILSKTTAINIEDDRQPSVTFHSPIDHLQNTRTRMVERRRSSCPSAAKVSDDLPCYFNIPLIPTFFVCSIFIIFMILTVYDILNGFS